MPSADVAIIGLGAMGSAVASALSRRGVRVIGFDRLRPPHNRGSSHGRTRVIREAYWEDPLYVPLVRAAFAAWRELEERSGRRLLTRTGALLVGPPESTLVSGTRKSARTYGVQIEELDGDELRRRFSPLVAPEDAIGLYEPRAGVLFPEDCVESFLDEAEKLGADLHFDEPISTWHSEGDSIHLETAAGSYSAGQALLATGAWTPTFLERQPLQVERQVMHWLSSPSNGPSFAPEDFPVFLVSETDDSHWYGLPDFGEGVKVALHHQGSPSTAEGLDREIAPREIEQMRALLARRIPALGAPSRRSCVCMYTNTPDSHFLVDRHPDHPGLLVASICSGHGFKFASIFGEILADLLEIGETRFDLTPFRLDRAALLS